jgi:hypothetical protein
MATSKQLPEGAKRRFIRAAFIGNSPVGIGWNG